MKKKNNTHKIDFVILWVDGSDEKWLNEKKKYCPELSVSNEAFKFRDWELLKYWFRGVEKYASWVNKIFFVTWGHVPNWLNIDNEKIVIVNHKEIIDKKYLPTYNSNVIDFNIHNIKDLSENFVYFNDDIFILNNVDSKDFFVDGIPKDLYAESVIQPDKGVFPYTRFNNAFIINKYYNKKEIYKNKRNKIFSIKYGKYNLRTLMNLIYPSFVGFYNQHICQPFLKSYFKKIWLLEPELCKELCNNKFRTNNDISQYLVKEMQILDGKTIPRKYNFGKAYSLNDKNYKEIQKTIEKQKYKVICINDSKNIQNVEKIKKELKKSFEKILPDKSIFEK